MISHSTVFCINKDVVSIQVVLDYIPFNCFMLNSSR